LQRPLIDDLHSIQRTITIAGNVRYQAPREDGSHADRWTALALALQAGNKPAIDWVFYPLSLGRRSHLDGWPTDPLWQ
jgi:hypothetical protein